MRVLVTGSSGFAGHWLLRHLTECGDEVVTLAPDLDVRDGAGLRRSVAAAGADGIIHLAGQASVAASWREPVTTLEVNAVGTAHLLEAAAAADPRPRVLLISSAEVYGPLQPADLPVAEDRPFAPASPYAASKAAAEMLGLQEWLGRGLEVVRARPFNHTGPGQRPDFAVPSFARQIVAAAERGETRLLTGNLDARRDLTDVRDVVRAYRLLLAGGRPGRAYNVCRGSSVAMSEVVEALLGLAGADLKAEVDPARVRPVDVPDLRGDPALIAADTGWRPEISLERTLADVLEYWRSPGRPPAG